MREKTKRIYQEQKETSDWRFPLKYPIGIEKTIRILNLFLR